MKSLWVDDLRLPPEGWDWAKTSKEAIDLLAEAYFSNDPYIQVSLDHDLGGEDTTRPVVLWMCEFDAFPQVCYAHTADPVGLEWLEGMLKRYGPGLTRLA